MDNNKKNDPRKKMPKFNMGWIYGLVILALFLVWVGGGKDFDGGSVSTTASYTDFKKFVAAGYASSIEITSAKDTLTLYVNIIY